MSRRLWTVTMRGEDTDLDAFLALKAQAEEAAATYNAVAVTR